MDNIAIQVENLSKRYRIGTQETKHDTLLAAAVSWLKSPLNNFRRLRSLTAFSANGDESDVLYALKDISFTVNQGEVVGIIGRNGAGKSTLLKILSRITPPSDGRIILNGRVASLLEVGTGFHPELTGRENVYLNGTVLGMTKTEVDRKFDEIVEFSGVEKFIDTPVKWYSSGMRVRLAFSVAAHLEPEILLVDEVLAVGDAEFQQKCLGKMQDVSRIGRTILFVSHNMPAIISLCPNSILLESGKIAYMDETEKVIRHYLDERQTHANQDLTVSSLERQGSGKIRFTHWTLVSEGLGESNKVLSNQACAFKLFYSGDTSHELRNVSLALVIKDNQEQPIVTGATHFLNSDFQTVPANGYFECYFPNLPLLPDMYQLYVWCSVQGETADVVEYAGSFEVVPNDIFGTGRFPRKKHGLVMLQHSWKMTPL